MSSIRGWYNVDVALVEAWMSRLEEEFYAQVVATWELLLVRTGNYQQRTRCQVFPDT